MADRMLEASDILEAEGLSRYEVASYAKPGKRCAHNIAYWTGDSYLGVGHAASSMLNAEQYKRLRLLAPQMPAAGPDDARVRFTCVSSALEASRATSWSDLAFDVEFLSAREAVAEDLMLAFRLSSGPGPELLSRARTLLGSQRVDDALGEALARGLVFRHDDGYAPTQRGWLLGNELYGLMWGLA